MKAVNRKMLIDWIEQTHADTVEEFKEMLLWRLKNEELFPIHKKRLSLWSGENIKLR